MPKPTRIVLSCVPNCTEGGYGKMWSFALWRMRPTARMSRYLSMCLSFLLPYQRHSPNLIDVGQTSRSLEKNGPFHSIESEIVKATFFTP